MTAQTAIQDDGGKQLKLTRASDVRARRVLFLSKEPPLPVGTLTVLAGPSGIGKTTIAERYCAKLTRGDLDGIYQGKPQNVLILSPEDDEAAIIRPRLEAAGADLDRVFFMASTRRTETGEMEAMLQFPADTHLLVEAVKETGAALVLLDPIASLISGNLDKREDVRAAFDRLAAEVAKEYQLCILMIAHNRKGVGQTRHMISGSTAITDAARSVLAVARDEENDTVVLAVNKSSYTTAEGINLAYQLTSVDIPLANGQTTTVARADFVGESTVTVEELHARHSGEEQAEDDRNAAQAFLIDYLRAEPGCEAEAKKVLQAGRSVGFNDKELRNARGRCRNPHIKSKKGAFKAGWIWAISDEELTKNSKDSGFQNMSSSSPSVSSSQPELAIITPMGENKK